MATRGRVAGLMGLGTFIAILVPTLVVGCGGKTTLWGSDGKASATSTTTSTSPTTTVTSKPTPTPRPTGDPDPEPEPSGVCPVRDPIDATSLPWSPPTVKPGACTDAEVNAFMTAIEHEDDPRKWKALLSSTTCKTCVFGDFSTTTWSPILEDGAGTPVQLNVGGCMAVVTGLPSCGRTYEQWYDCRLEACADCNDDREYARCVSAADKGACKKAFDAVAPACGGQAVLTKADSACFGDSILYGPIYYQCVGAPDGGPIGP